MQQLNDDMDDLLRRAAEQYPLNTNGTDWDKVLQNLNTQPDSSLKEVAKEGGGKRYRNLLWLLLLLPVAWVYFNYIGGTKKTSITQVAPNAAKQEDVKNAENSLAKKDAKQNDGSLKEKIPVTVEQNDKVTGGKTRAEKNTDNNKTEDNSGNIKTGVTAKSKQQKHKAVVNNIAEGSLKEAVTKKKDGVAKSDNNKVLPAADNISQSKPSDKNSTVDKNKSTDTTAAEVANNITDTPGKKPGEVINKPVEKKDDSALVTANKAEDNKVNNTSAKQDDKAVQKPLVDIRQKQFYVGLLGGADLSTVKLASLSAGYSVGGILGYRINNHWGVEAGFFWDKKNYYADGKDFNTSKLTMLPQHTYILNVDGYCNMYEIPLNVNYYFGKESGYSWFVNAGASSYLMHREYYDYLAERYNVQWPGSWSYKNSSKDWFSVLNIGAGLDKQIGKSGKLRLQPYFKIPVGGVGKGSLPITSAGFYIGYTLKLF